IERLFHRILCHAQFGSNFRLGGPALFANEEFFQLIEQRSIARGSVLSLESGEYLLQHRQRPAPLVKPISAQRFGELEIGDLRLEQFLQWDMRTALVPLNTAGALPLAGQEMFERHEQIRTQTSLLAADSLQTSSFKQTGEKFLDQILCVLWFNTLASDKSVERSPISSAKYFECFLRSGR